MQVQNLNTRRALAKTRSLESSAQRTRPNDPAPVTWGPKWETVPSMEK